jgi:hypothetical protein
MSANDWPPAPPVPADPAELRELTVNPAPSEYGRPDGVDTWRIFAAMAEVMRTIRDAPRVPSKEYARGIQQIDQIADAAHDALAKQGIWVSPRMLAYEREDRATAKGAAFNTYIVTGRLRFIADDGSWCEAGPFYVEGVDLGDKAMSKAATYLAKMLRIVFMIGFTASDDPDQERTEGARSGTAAADAAAAEERANRDGAARARGWADHVAFRQGRGDLSATIRALPDDRRPIAQNMVRDELAANQQTWDTMTAALAANLGARIQVIRDSTQATLFPDAAEADDDAAEQAAHDAAHTTEDGA